MDPTPIDHHRQPHEAGTSALRRLVAGLVAAAGVVASLSPAWALGELFVTNYNNASVTVYPQPASGNTAPLRVLAGAAASLLGPNGIVVDTENDEIVVASNNTIKFFPRTATGDVAPVRIIAGGSTALDTPIGVVVDPVNDEIVVANVANSGSITVYPRNGNGNILPLRRIAGGNTGMLNPWGVVVDAVHNEIIIADAAVDRVLTYGRTATGNIAPLRTLTGAQTGINGPRSLVLNAATDQLFVANADADSITVHARTANGNTPPVRTITGPGTGLDSPTGLALDGAEIVVANSTAVTVYPIGASGNAAPTRTLTGAATGLSLPVGVAVAHPPILISTGTGPSGSPHVKIFQFDPSTGVPVQSGAGFFPYDAGFLGGVQSTLVRTKDGLFVVTGVGSGGGPHIRLFKVTNLADGTVTGIGGGFLAYDAGFLGGARVAATADSAGNLFIITGVGSGGAAHVKVFQVTDLATGAVSQVGGGFFAYDPGFLGGVNVGAQ
jgi:hypothetical protein